MKRIIALLTALTIVANAFGADKDKKDDVVPVEPAMGVAPILLGMLVITVAVTATVVIIKCNSTNPSDTNPVVVILEQSADHANWIPVATTNVTLKGTMPIDVFSEELRNGPFFYRAIARRP